MSRKKKKTAGQAITFLTILIIMFLFLDLYLRTVNPVGHSVFFRKNDFEITVALHETSEFDRVFYGNSAVVSAFRENDSSSGYVELGLLLGTVSDLQAMLERGYVTVSESIVLGLNIFVLMDDLPTDPSYIWHRRAWEPYLFFYRDRIWNFFTNTFDGFLNGIFSIRRFTNLQKYLYFGSMSDLELDERLADFEERFWGLPLYAFEKNLAALEWLIEFCQTHDIRLRILWMPYNPHSPKPEIYEKVMVEANAIFEAHGVEVKDWTHAFARENFYDTGHFNDEVGAGNFTREIDAWLGK
ncbi:MAG: hypothetical protein FWB97_06190 [Oscillospiraceae bacterium]|nr:hypothetical protein [Oscillospiraceae bacterium]